MITLKQLLERVKDGKVDPLSKMGKSKLTGREISNYYKDNPDQKKAARDKDVKKGIELALDLGGAMDYARKELEKFKRGLSKHPAVKKALMHANESVSEENGAGDFGTDKLRKKYEKDTPKESVNETKKQEVDAMKKISKDMQAVLKAYQKVATMGDKTLKNTKYNAQYKKVLDARDTILTMIGTLNTQMLLTKEETTLWENLLQEEMITYRVKKMQKPEEDKFQRSAKMMGLKYTSNKGRDDTVIVVSGTKKKLRDFDSVVRGKSSYGDPSTIKHFDEAMGMGDKIGKLFKTKDKKEIDGIANLMNMTSVKVLQQMQKQNPKGFKRMAAKMGEMPAMEGKDLSEFTLSENTIEKMRKIVADKQAMKINGVMVDMFTASAVVQIYDKVNDGNKKKMEKMKPVQLANLAMKIMRKQSTNEAVSPAQQAAIAISKKEKGEKPKKENRSARRDAMRGMSTDKDFMKKDDDDIVATPDDRKAADKNPLIQLRRIADLPKGGDMEFKDGKKKKITQKDAMKALKGFSALRKNPDKLKFQTMVGKSHSDLKRILKLIR